MKTILRKILKFFFYLSYPLLIVALIISFTLLVVKSRELDGLNSTFSQATSELNKDNENKQVTIEDLKQEFAKLNAEIVKLNAENTSLKDSVKQSQLEGYGVLSGRIFPVVTSSNSGFSQYQRVCAVSTKNPNMQVCQTVSAMNQDFTISMPVGNYNVYAEIFPEPKEGTPLAGAVAYYSEYVKCVQEKGTDNCDQKKLTKPVNVDVKAGETIAKVDPIDWR